MNNMPRNATFLGRARIGDRPYPMVVTVRDSMVFDITASGGATVSEVCEQADPAAYVRQCKGRSIGKLDDIAANSFEADHNPSVPSLLSPVDLQSIKASGVTFVASLLERVIEEQARGAAEKAEAIRNDITGLIGTDLSKLKPGSPAAMEIKARLVERGAWSQYLEVGIGPDAEIFTKCQPMSSVGFGADIGIFAGSTWNNPEPEIAVIVASSGSMVGATLGNDLNLRDVEGRSALLLGRAKDNNASASLGPFIRMFDGSFSVSDIETAKVQLSVQGEDGFSLRGESSMTEISRSPEELVHAAMGSHHQYPDGMALYLGTMFVPSKDRDEPGKGFTHHIGDIVAISTESLGTLVNRVRYANDCPPWTYGVRQLMKDLAGANLLGGG